MDKNTVQHLPCEGERCTSTTFQSSSFFEESFRVMPSLQKDALLCDIKLETNDGKIIYGHKVVLASACPYFLAMFTNFNEKDKDHILIKDIDSNSLELLINYIYTGTIIVNEENVLVLLAAANFFLMDSVKSLCMEYMRTQLGPSNCIGIKQFADLHDCTELIIRSKAYIKTHFLEVVKNNEFLCLSSEELIELISSNYLTAPKEQNVFESVLNWTKHEPNSRNKYFKDVMAHVRLPLIPTEYLLNNIVEHPLIKISPECEDYVKDALSFNLLKKQTKIVVPQTIRCTRRLGNLNKIILMLSWKDNSSYITCHDPTNNQWNIIFETGQWIQPGRIALLKNQFIFSVEQLSAKSQILDLSSPNHGWIPLRRMKVDRCNFGVGIINDCVYVIGGLKNYPRLEKNNAEIFDINIKKWRMVSSKPMSRSYFGVGVLNNLLYVVGGTDYNCYGDYLKSIECYDPSLDTWTQVAELLEGRSDITVGVLDGTIYAIGGFNELGYSKSVEAYRPSDGFCTSVADLQMARVSPEVVTLNGLIYVMGGTPYNTDQDSIEIYNPKTNTWTLIKSYLKCAGQLCGALVIERPPEF